MAPLVFRRQNVWARQLNQETDTQASSDAAKILNDGAKLWAFGVKTERAGTVIRTIGGGTTEVLGAFVYATGTEKVDPMFAIVDASASLAGVVQRSFGGVPFTAYVVERRGEDARTLATATSSLYSGYTR
jgi:hypothetical protein